MPSTDTPAKLKPDNTSDTGKTAGRDASGKQAKGKADASKKLTPAMRQYQRFKEQHPGCVLFFRMGDFYEMFYEDAVLAHKTLGVTLTQRTEGVPMAGVPYHSVEGYLRRMIQAGHRVAVCEQVEDAAQAKGVVKRDVTRVVTPGTLTDENLLDDAKAATCAAVVFHKDDLVSLAWAELSTGGFQAATLAADAVGDELARIGPSELIYCETADGEVPPRVAAIAHDVPTTPRPGWAFRQRDATEALRKQYGVASMAGYGFADDDPALAAAGALLHYLNDTQRTGEDGRLAPLQPPRRYEQTRHLIIDQASLTSLEIEKTLRGSDEGSLLAVMRKGGGSSAGGCLTGMGRRRLRDWLCYPLADRDAIQARQRVVRVVVDDSRFADELGEVLDGLHDIPRITARLAVGRLTPRDLVALGRSADRATALSEALSDRPAVANWYEKLAEVAPTLQAMAKRIAEACIDEPPAHLRDGGLIREGFDASLDECRSLKRDANTWLAGYQKELTELTDIPSLKVGYNKVFGYYIEVTAAHKQKIRDEAQTYADWSRKQTLKNAERYITPDLKQFEGKVLSADGRAIAREQDLFTQLCGDCEKHIEALHTFAEAAADLDVLLCFGRRAVRFNHCCPDLVNEPCLHLADARHPVLDELISDGFVPNDVGLGSCQGSKGPRGQAKNSATTENLDDEQKGDEAQNSDPRHPDPSTPSLALITGPNMAGKSTYIRTAALITLLAHTGSFVPASSATLGLCDRIFTRVGAHDELHAGRSTFMVEMTETANLCHHATARSLVILDEIGRGTSTLDGLSLAWAITEHLASVGCRCLFATHYHELTGLADTLPNVTNLNVTVREWNDEIVFLHRIVPGATDRSYGIQVAKLAGLPHAVVDRAHELLGQLAVNHGHTPPSPAATSSKPQPQLSLFTEYVDHPVVGKLRGLDLDRFTPMQAFDMLRDLRRELTKPDAADRDE
jgi:DNA mismatch repair protein MutS